MKSREDESSEGDSNSLVNDSDQVRIEGQLLKSLHIKVILETKGSSSVVLF